MDADREQCVAPSVRVRPVRPDGEDLAFIRRLRNEQIRSGTALWVDDPEDCETTRAWVERHRAAGAVLIAQQIGPDGSEGERLGVAAIGPFRDEPGYRRTAEDSVYVAEHAHHRGVGLLLMESLVRSARERGLHALIAAIESGNQASIGLHSRAGFRTVGTLRQVGAKFGRWLDLTLMELVLDDPAVPPSQA